jgi:hypothetical protein
VTPSLAEDIKYVDEFGLDLLTLQKKEYLLTDGLAARAVNVVIGNHCVRGVLHELVRCFAMQVFRLNHTERMAFQKLRTNQAITYVFGRYNSFPQFRSVTIPRACSILELFSQCADVQAIWFEVVFFSLVPSHRIWCLTRHYS